MGCSQIVSDGILEQIAERLLHIDALLDRAPDEVIGESNHLHLSTRAMHAMTKYHGR